VSFGQDGSYSHEAIVNRANAELANSFGNLAQRVLSMIFKNLGGELPEVGQAADDVDLLARVREACTGELVREFDQFAFAAGIEAWLRAVFACNQYVDAQAPWGLRKTDPDRMGAVLGTLFACIRDLAVAISPIVPASADKLLDLMGISASERDFAALADTGWYERLRAAGFRLGAPAPIFPRLEFPEGADAGR